MRKAYLFIVTAIALIFCISLTSYLPSYAFGPVIVQAVNNQLVAAQVGIITQTITTSASDTLIVGSTGALRSGADGGITISGNNGLTCQVAVNDATGGTGGGAGAVAISVCPNTLATTYTIQGQWTSNVCGGGNPCGFMGLWIYELSGGGFTYTNTSGSNGNTVGNTGTTNTITFGIPALLLGFTALNTASSVTTNGSSVFSLTAACSVSGVNSATPTCAEQASVLTTTTNFPFKYSQANNQWTDEGIAITGGAPATSIFSTTLTVTAWNTIDPGTPISWITLALFLTLIPGLMWGALRGFGARPSATVFFTLVSCFIGSIMGTISGVDLGVNAIVPLGITVFNGIALGLYVILSRQRGNPVT